MEEPEAGNDGSTEYGSFDWLSTRGQNKGSIGHILEAPRKRTATTDEDPRNSRKKFFDQSPGRGAKKDASDVINLEESDADGGLYTRKPPVVGATGFENLGNTCYLAAVLVSLMHVSDGFWKSLSGLRSTTAKLLLDLHAEYWAGEKASLAPSDVLAQLRDLAPQFTPPVHHDAQEALSALLDSCHGQLLRSAGLRTSEVEPPKPPKRQRSDEVEDKAQWEQYVKKGTPVSRTFHGLLASKLLCPHCDKPSASNTYDPFVVLPLPLRPEMGEDGEPAEELTLNRCLEQFLEKEKLGLEDQWVCPKCSKTGEAEKTLRLSHNPDVLIIQLKRFTLGRFGLTEKVRHPVHYPLDLTDLTNGKEKYKLSATVFHHGPTLHLGHYTCDARIGEDWYNFDDSTVRPTTIKEEASDTVYLLFYERVGAAKAARGGRARKK